MCNLYSVRKGAVAILDPARAMRSGAGNFEGGSIYPDYAPPIHRMEGGEQILTTAC